MRQPECTNGGNQADRRGLSRQQCAILSGRCGHLIAPGIAKRYEKWTFFDGIFGESRGRSDGKGASNRTGPCGAKAKSIEARENESVPWHTMKPPGTDANI